MILRRCFWWVVVALGAALGVLVWADANAAGTCTTSWAITSTVPPDLAPTGYTQQLGFGGSGGSACQSIPTALTCDFSSVYTGYHTDNSGRFNWANTGCTPDDPPPPDPPASGAVLSDSQALNFLAYGFLVLLLPAGYIAGRLR